MEIFDALVSMSQTVLRFRDQWKAGATAFSDIDAATNQCADLLRADGGREFGVGMIESAIAELKRRATPFEQEPIDDNPFHPESPEGRAWEAEHDVD